MRIITPIREQNGVFSRFLKKSPTLRRIEMKKYVGILATLMILFSFIFITSPNEVAAEGANVTNALKESGITNTGKMDGVYKDLNGVVYFVMALGGFWIVGMLVWGGMTLAGSGGNPQKRTEGFIKLSLVLVGAYIIFKAYDIAGWATGLGA